MGKYALGQSVPRSEDPRLLRGGGKFADDRSLPGMAHGVVLRSPHAHAKILSIDTSAAEAAPGVLAVLTGADWQELGWGDVPGDPPRKLRDGSIAFAPPFPALVSDRVRCVGDCVAFVVAQTKMQALDAAEAIVVDYDPLPAIVDTEGAAADGAPMVWDEAPNNIAFVPQDGDSSATMTVRLTQAGGDDDAVEAEIARRRAAANANGGVPPDTARMFDLPREPADRFDWVARRVVPHPVNTQITPVRLTNGGGDGLARTYILCTDASGPTPFMTQAKTIRSDDSWIYRELDTTHDAMVTEPGAVADLLLEAAV